MSRIRSAVVFKSLAQQVPFSDLSHDPESHVLQEIDLIRSQLGSNLVHENLRRLDLILDVSVLHRLLLLL